MHQNHKRFDDIEADLRIWRKDFVSRANAVCPGLTFREEAKCFLSGCSRRSSLVVLRACKHTVCSYICCRKVCVDCRCGAPLHPEDQRGNFLPYMHTQY